MIHSLTLANFKPFGDPQTAAFAPITLIYGPNSGGKSSLIQSLLLMKQTLEGYGPFSPPIAVKGTYADLGSFKSLLHGHLTNRNLVLDLEFSLPGLPAKGMPSLLSPATRRRVGVRYHSALSPVTRRKDTGVLSAVTHEVWEQQFSTLRVELDRKGSDGEAKSSGHEISRKCFFFSDEASIQSLVGLFDRLAHDRYVSERGSDALAALNKDINAVATLLRQSEVMETNFSPLPTRIMVHNAHRGTPEDRSFLLDPLNGFLRGLAGGYKALFESISYLGPFRQPLQRFYPVGGTKKFSVGTSGENLASVTYGLKDSVTGAVDSWFDRFEIPYSLRVTPVGDDATGPLVGLSLVDRNSGVRVSPVDVGFGVGQLLPIIVESLTCGGGTIVVEQPEIHLHPRLQAHIADLLIETSGVLSPADGRKGRKKRQLQWLVETHSETLMLRLQRRIREGRISHEDVSVLYVEPAVRGGSRIRQLALAADGDFIDEWPDGFFEEGFTELFSRRARWIP